MDEIADPRGELKSPSRGARDAAAVLPLAALCLLTPPILLIFARPAAVGGVPLIIVYIFGIWALIVLASFLVARTLRSEQTSAEADSRPADGHGGVDGA